MSQVFEWTSSAHSGIFERTAIGKFWPANTSSLRFFSCTSIRALEISYWKDWITVLVSLITTMMLLYDVIPTTYSATICWGSSLEYFVNDDSISERQFLISSSYSSRSGLMLDIEGAIQPPSQSARQQFQAIFFELAYFTSWCKQQWIFWTFLWRVPSWRKYKMSANISGRYQQWGL